MKNNHCYYIGFLTSVAKCIYSKKTLSNTVRYLKDSGVYLCEIVVHTTANDGWFAADLYHKPLCI